MKKISAIMLALISSNTFAFTIISEEHYRSPAFKDVPHIKFEHYESGALSHTFAVDNLYAKTKNASGNANKAIPVWTKQFACLSNKTSKSIQYGYRFDLIVGNDNALDSATFFLNPGESVCPNRDGYANFTPEFAGNYTIYAITRGAEGKTVKEVSDKAILTAG